MTVWQEAASCRGQGALFFSLNPERRRQALAICEACPVLGPCRDEALRSEAVGVVQGGLDLTDAKNLNEVLRRHGRTTRITVCRRCGAEFEQPILAHGGPGYVNCVACRPAKKPQRTSPCRWCGTICEQVWCSDDCRRFGIAARKNRYSRDRRATA